MSWIFYVFYIGVWSYALSEANKYDNYTLIRLVPEIEKQLENITRFEDPDNEIEILKQSRGLNDSLDVIVPPNKLDYIEHFARSINVIPEVTRRNYGRSFETPQRSPRRRLFRRLNLFHYNSHTAIQEYLDAVSKRHPDIVRLQVLGTSYQGRVMRLAKISTDPDAGNPIIFIDAGIHAREWVAPAMALYIIHKLTSSERSDLNGVDWYILPVVNPDGYEYTRTSRSNRLWRKTRSKNANCYGVDGNRNFGFKWAVSGVSNNPCNKETYAGPEPFSEPETQMVRNVMLENAKRIKLYVSIHSYGQYLVYPWGYTGDFMPKEWKKLDGLARAVSDAVVQAGGQPFKVLSAGKWYPAAGGSDDFAFGAVGIPYSYTMELTDGYEFIYPEQLLGKVLPQFYEGFRVLGNHIRKEFSSIRNRRYASYRF